MASSFWSSPNLARQLQIPLNSRTVLLLYYYCATTVLLATTALLRYCTTVLCTTHHCTVPGLRLGRLRRGVYVIEINGISEIIEII